MASTALSCASTSRIAVGVRPEKLGAGTVQQRREPQSSQLVSQLSTCYSTGSYGLLRGRERAMHLTVANERFLVGARSTSSARLAMVHAGLSERIASSQFCSSSSSHGSSSVSVSLSGEFEGFRCFLGRSEIRARRRVDVHEFKQFLGRSEVGARRKLDVGGSKQFFGPGWLRDTGSWNRNQTQSARQGSRGQKTPSENLDVGEFKSEISLDASAGHDSHPSVEGEQVELPSAVGKLNGAPGVERFVAPDPPPSSGFDSFPKRWIIVILCFFAFLLCNMDRVNMSIAILPMAAEYHWTPTTVGVVQSSFFWGYLLTQVAGGIWADSIGGKQVLGFGVIWWSLATIATPIAAKIGLPALLFVRACMGVGEGVAMPAMNNLLSRWIPVEERSRSLAFVYSGMYLGSVIGLACSPGLIQRFGWPSVFFSFGSIGAIWFAIWEYYAHSTPAEDPALSEAELKLILKGNKPRDPIARIPWGLILSKAPVWALIVCHFCHNWGTFILLTWMPTYYNQVLGFNLMESGLFSVLPWLTMAVSANLGGWIADTLVSKGYSVTTVRKAMQTIGFLGPAFFLTQLGHISSPPMAVLCMMASQGTDAFSQAGLYSNHQDIGPRYSGILLGLSNTAGVLAGVFGTAATGYILQHGSWDDVFKVAVGLYLFGTVVWNVFSTGEQLFD